MTPPRPAMPEMTPLRAAATPPVRATEAAPVVSTSNLKVETVPPTVMPEVTKTEPAVVNEVLIVLDNLKDSERLHIDSIIESSGLNAQTVLRLLLELELEGRITQHPGKLFSLA